MRPLKSRKGTTLVEAMVAAGILSLVTITFTALFIQSLRGWSVGTSGQTSTGKATVAIQRLGNDIRDARSAQVVSGVLVVTFPQSYVDVNTGERIYDLSANDPVTRSYYVSNGNLVRTAGGTTTILCRGVSEATFHAWGANVTITTLVGTDREGTRTAYQQLTGSIALRNFKS